MTPLQHYEAILIPGHCSCTCVWFNVHDFRKFNEKHSVHSPCKALCGALTLAYKSITASNKDCVRVLSAEL